VPALGDTRARRSGTRVLGRTWRFADYHTDDVLGDVHGQPQTHGIREHIDAMKAFVETTGGTPVQIKSHPIGFGSGEWTCVVGELRTVAGW